MSREARNAPWSIGKAAQVVALSSPSVTVDVGSTQAITATWLGDGTLSATSSNTAYATVSVSGSTITVTGVAEGSVTITASVSAGTNYIAGSATASATVEQAPSLVGYLRFSSENPFSLSTANSNKNWDGTLEWRAGEGNWATWNGMTTLSSETGTLDLRGTGNTYITGSNGNNARFVLTGSQISCSGNIESILDYQKAEAGNHPAMANYCFRGLFLNCSALVCAPLLPALNLKYYCYTAMFANCTSLITAPTLPAMTMADLCYNQMFAGCTALVSPPTLPATALSTGCYKGMFQGCTALTVAPALPAQTLQSACYEYMFKGCTALTVIPLLPAANLTSDCYHIMFDQCSSLKISSSSGGDYQYAYRIPSSGIGSLGTSSLQEMFRDTGGTFTGTPSINTTYYTDHAPIS